jgi:ABC-type glycerol-3-phosphate transport system permease component
MTVAAADLPVSRLPRIRWKKWALTLAWSIAAFIYLFPYTWMVLTGFRNPVDTVSMPPRFIFAPTLDGFIKIFTASRFQYYLLHSTVVSISCVLVTLALSAPAAYALAQLKQRGRAILLGLLIARMMPGMALVVPVYLIATDLGQLDTYQVLIIMNVAFNLPFGIWMLRGFYMEVNPALREAAIVDGATEFQVFARIVTPLVRGGVMATSVFIFLAAWNEFLFAVILSDVDVATAPVAMLSFRSQYGIDWDSIGAASLVISTPVVVFAVAMQKYLVQGLTLGAVK